MDPQTPTAATTTAVPVVGDRVCALQESQLPAAPEGTKWQLRRTLETYPPKREFELVSRAVAHRAEVSGVAYRTDRNAVFSPFIDLRHPPMGLLADPLAYNTLMSLLSNPQLNLDGDMTRLSVDEWKLALTYLHTFHPQMQRGIEHLRGYFVLAQPPSGPVIDLMKIPPTWWRDESINLAVQYLTRSPGLDLDGYPGLISEAELIAAEQVAYQLPPLAQQGLRALRAYFDDLGGEVGSRTVRRSSTGADVEIYRTTDGAYERAEEILQQLAAHRGFAELLSNARVIVSPPGKGLGAIEELGLGEEGEGYEGLAEWQGLGSDHRPTAAISHGSLMGWDLGLVHELIHLLVFQSGYELTARGQEVLKGLRAPDYVPDAYANVDEMFAYFGQWYLAGFGEVIRGHSEQVYDLLRDLFGDLRLRPRALSPDQGEVALESLFHWFRTGKKPGVGGGSETMPEGLPEDRAEAWKLLQAKGIQNLYTGFYPPDIEVPEALRQMPFAFAMAPGVEIVCQQGNNTMIRETTHNPEALRYALDFGAPDMSSGGLPIVANGPGVAYVYGGARDNKPDNWGFGNMVVIDHGNGFASMLCHLDEVQVQNGEAVEAGQSVGTMGKTGNAGNCHLHFQVVQLRRQPDPENEVHHYETGSTNYPPPYPFGETVPFLMRAADRNTGTAALLESTEFQGGEAGALLEHAHRYAAVS